MCLFYFFIYFLFQAVLYIQNLFLSSPDNFPSSFLLYLLLWHTRQKVGLLDSLSVFLSSHLLSSLVRISLPQLLFLHLLRLQNCPEPRGVLRVFQRQNGVLRFVDVEVLEDCACGTWGNGGWWSLCWSWLWSRLWWGWVGSDWCKDSCERESSALTINCRNHCWDVWWLWSVK